MLRSLCVPVVLQEKFQSQYKVKSAMIWNRNIALVDWKGTDVESNCLQPVLEWRNSAVHGTGTIPDLHNRKLQISCSFPFAPCSFRLAVEEIASQFTLLDGITRDDASTIQKTLDVPDGHAFLDMLYEACECDII